MFYQLQFTDVVNKFLSNEEYLECFASMFDIPERMDNLKGYFFDESEIISWVQREPTIDGFVLENQYVQLFFISPSKNYMGFWGHRNFFTWRLAKKHSNNNDGVKRYVINFCYRYEPCNKTDNFDIIKDFYIINIFVDNMTDDQKQWLRAIFKDF